MLTIEAIPSTMIKCGFKFVSCHKLIWRFARQSWLKQPRLLIEPEVVRNCRPNLLLPFSLRAEAHFISLGLTSNDQSLCVRHSQRPFCGQDCAKDLIGVRVLIG